MTEPGDVVSPKSAEVEVPDTALAPNVLDRLPAVR
jgi:hypothetical protein